jgi:hypothetical protein
MRARYYDPEVGRFASEDPGRNGENWYWYANSNPVCNVDPDGKKSEDILTLQGIRDALNFIG